MNENIFIEKQGKEISEEQVYLRVGSIIFTILSLITAYFIVAKSSLNIIWEYHFILGLLTSFTALIVGVMAVIKYISRRKPMYIFIGIAFITMFIIHVLSDYELTRFQDLHIKATAFEIGILYLSIFLFFSFLSWVFDQELFIKYKNILNFSIYLFSSFLSVGILLYFILDLDLSFLNLFAASLASFLLVLTFAGYLSKQLWKYKYFEFWMLIALIFLFSSVLIEIIGSDIYSPLFLYANILRLLSYMTLLIGLLASVHNAFSLVEEGADKMNKQNDELRQISEALQAKSSELRHERDQAQLIIASMAEGLLVIGQDYKIQLMNPVAERLLEVAAEQAVGKKWSDIVTAFEGKEQIPFSERTSIVVLRTGKTIVTAIDDDHYYKTLSGKFFSVSSITAPLYEHGKVIGAVKVFRDATEDKMLKRTIEKKVKERTYELEQAKEKITQGWFRIQQEKAKMWASINSLALGFIMTDVDNNVILTNDAIKVIFGPEIAGNDILHRLAETFSNSFDLYLESEKCKKENKIFEISEVLYKDKYLRVFIAPIELESQASQVIGLVYIIEDVTEEKLLEHTKDEFFALASHELRTPLTTLQGNIDLIQKYFEKKIKDQEVRGMVGDVKESALRLGEVVSEFLDVSELEQKRMPFNEEEFDMSNLASQLVKEMSEAAEDKKLTLTYKQPKPKPAKVIGDKTRAKQILGNLIDNAIKYTHEGSVTVTLAQIDNEVEVHVTDTGEGIPLENQSMLFKKFMQASQNILSRNAKGVGLGLYISKLLVEGMKGKIYLESSTVGKGSTFIFTLPLAQKVVEKKAKSK